MAIIKPFRALRPLPNRVTEVAAVPYDVVNTEEARALAADNPLSFLHVSRPEIDLPEGTDIYSDQVYRKGAENFHRLAKEAPLIKEDEPYFYLYSLRLNEHEQTGLVACCSVDEYDNNLIRKHERTRLRQEDDRTRHILTLRAQTGPVFLIYRSQNRIEKLSNRVRQSTPLFDFTASDGINHVVWRVPPQDNQEFLDAFSKVPVLYIADGHHRAKGASRVRKTLQAQDPHADQSKEYHFFQCVIFPDNQIQILPYNRIVTDLNHRKPEELLHALELNFEISKNVSPKPKERGQFSLYLRNCWYGLRPRHQISQGISLGEQLDVAVLHDKILGPILGIKDVQTTKQIDYIGGVNSIREIERLVDEGRASVGFSLFPTSIDELLSVADAGEIMPPKSTWFEPKLRDGILIHLI